MWIIRRKSRRVFSWPSVPHVVIADTPALVREMVKELRQYDTVGVDVEGYGANPKVESPVHKARAVSAQFSTDKMPMFFVPFWTVRGMTDDGRWDVDLEGRLDLMEALRPFVESRRRTKVLHGGKYDRHVFANHGLDLRGHLGDTLVMDYLAFNGAMLHGLKECIRRYAQRKWINVQPLGSTDAQDMSEVFRTPRPLKRKGKNGETLYGKATYVPSMDEIVTMPDLVPKLVSYAGKDPFFTVHLFHFLKDRLKQVKWCARGDYYEYYRSIERPYSDVLFDMEREGAPVDQKKLLEVKKRLDEDIVLVEKELLRTAVVAGAKQSQMAELNINSTNQIRDLLYGTFKIAPKYVTEKGAAATNRRALDELSQRRSPISRTDKFDVKKHGPVIQAFMAHRSKTTLRKMFVNKLSLFVPQYNGRIHSTFKQTGTATGRLSSAAPNVENIPAAKKDEEYKLRSMFVAPPGYEVADIDLSQIEVRLTVHYTRDPVLLELIQNGHDQHLEAMRGIFPEVARFCGDEPSTKELAEKVEKKFGKEAYSEMRRKGKVLNFGTIYGMGPQGYAAQVGGTIEEGKVALHNYFRRFWGLKRGIKKIQRSCYDNGYVRTILGRYCEIPGIRSSDNAIRAASERQAFNYVIQGSASDLIKMGMILCHKDKTLRRLGVKLVNQVHDELVFLVPVGHREEVKPLIESYVSQPYKHFGFKGLIVPTPADLGFGPSWMEAKS